MTPRFFMPALYVHVPFCRRKCPYCDFFSVPGEAAQMAAYVDLLCRHLELAADTGWRGPFDTVFLGGGTPSLLPPAAVGRILEMAHGQFGLADGAEISLEANPGTLSLGSLTGYRAAGVNRLSLGLQSLSRKNLRLLGRIHSPAEAVEAARWARRAGFVNLSCDLMFALPGQTRRGLLREVEALLRLEPDHLSCYGLTVEEETPFYHLHRAGGLPLPKEERYAELYRTLHERLTAAGYRHYEISNYARPGRECRHNLRYWSRRSYLGIGAGAHSFCTQGWGERLAVPPDLSHYATQLTAGANPTESLETFDRRGAMAETLYLGLRTESGVVEADFRNRFGAGVAEAFPAAMARAGKRLRLTDASWRLDLDGWLLYDHLITPFL